MTVFIFEGPDNLGKSTIIKSLVNEYKDVRDICMIHFTGPHCENGEDPFEYQKRTFFAKVKKIITISQYNKLIGKQNDDIIILDRSWIGEYVYGQIYRNGNADKIINMINDCNAMLSREDIKLVFVRLDATPEFVIYHDDNKSFTSDYDESKRLATVTKEIKLFKEAFDKIAIDNTKAVKMSVCVQNVNSNTADEYRTVDSIYNQIKANIKIVGIEI